jgi:hypothetical protein
MSSDTTTQQEKTTAQAAATPAAAHTPSVKAGLKEAALGLAALPRSRAGKRIAVLAFAAAALAAGTSEAVTGFVDSALNPVRPAEFTATLEDGTTVPVKDIALFVTDE